MAVPFVERVASVVQLEYAILIFLGSFCVWVFYKIALKDVNSGRHQSLQEKLLNLAKHLGILLLFALPYFFLSELQNPHLILAKSIPYLGLVVLFWGTLSILKLTRIAVLEFLFLGNMKAGVPLLIVNIFTLVLSLGLTGWYLSTIFEIRLMPLLATSAVFSLVLGLALQDTISNLFAGIGIQFDHSYQIGDWIEVFYQNQKWAGQVEEMSWRSTVLVSLTDEFIIIPNRSISQSLIHNFSNQKRPFLRSHIIKVDYHVEQSEMRQLLIQASKGIDGILETPLPAVLLWELGDSGAAYKLVYFISNFGKQYSIADKLLSNIMTALEFKKIKIAKPKLEIRDNASS